MSARKRAVLGRHMSSAMRALTRDLLFHFAVSTGHKCYRCGNGLDRETFSIDHKQDWLNSDDPKAKFYDIENIAFSHLRCNITAPRIMTAGAAPLPSRKRKTQEYMARYYQEHIKGKVTSTEEFKAHRRDYMRQYNARKKLLPS
jgi:hypothetical protein